MIVSVFTSICFIFAILSLLYKGIILRVNFILYSLYKSFNGLIFILRLNLICIIAKGAPNCIRFNFIRDERRFVSTTIFGKTAKGCLTTSCD